MTEEFDPYFTWLGIAREEQPAHLYRLLGVRPFEDSLDVIGNAADRQMLFLRQLQTGARSQFATRLLNEISQARIVLLNPLQKARYDQALSEVLRASAGVQYHGPVVVPVHVDTSPRDFEVEVARYPSETTTVADTTRVIPSSVLVSTGLLSGSDQRPLHGGKAEATRNHSSNSSWNQWGMVLVGAVLGGLVLVVIATFQPSGNKNVAKSSSDKQPQKIEIKKPVERDLSQPETASSQSNGHFSHNEESEKEPERTNSSRALSEALVHYTVFDQSVMTKTEDRLTWKARLGMNWHAASKDLEPVSEHGIEISGKGLRCETMLLNQMAQFTVVWTGRFGTAPFRFAEYEHYGGIVGEFVIGAPPSNVFINIWNKSALNHWQGQDLALPAKPDSVEFIAWRCSADSQTNNCSVWLDSEKLEGSQQVLDYDLPAGQHGHCQIGLETRGVRLREMLVYRRYLTDEELVQLRDGKRPELENLARVAQDSKPMAMDQAATIVGKDTYSNANESAKPEEMSTPAEKQPPPAGEQLARAMNDVALQYNGRLAGTKTAEERRSIAKQILLSSQVEPDPVVAYALLRRAHKIAVDAQDFDLGTDIVAQVDSHFRIDRLKVLTEFLEQASRWPLERDRRKDLFARILEAARLAVAERRFEEAIIISELATAVAVKSTDPVLKADAGTLRQYAKGLRALQTAAEDAEAQLRENPDDQAANLALGRYYAFGVNELEAGLKHLVKGKDKKLAFAAVRTLPWLQSENPSDAAANQMSDLWFDMLDDLQVAERYAMARFVYSTYSKHLDSLEGEHKIKIRKRLEGLRATLSSYERLFPSGSLDERVLLPGLIVRVLAFRDGKGFPTPYVGVIAPPAYQFSLGRLGDLMRKDFGDSESRFYGSGYVLVDKATTVKLTLDSGVVRLANLVFDTQSQTTIRQKEFHVKLKKGIYPISSVLERLDGLRVVEMDTSENVLRYYGDEFANALEEDVTLPSGVKERSMRIDTLDVNGFEK